MACATWSPDTLARRFPTQPVEVMVCDPDARPTGESPYYERRRLAFADAVALMGEEAGRCLNLVAQNRVLADPAFEELWADLAFDPDWFDASAVLTHVSLWVSPRHAVTPLHYDLENTLLAMVFGRKRVIFASPADTENLAMCRSTMAGKPPPSPASISAASNWSRRCQPLPNDLASASGAATTLRRRRSFWG